MGAALQSLGDGELGAGDEVSESQLPLLIGMGRDPHALTDTLTFRVPPTVSI